MNSSKDGEKDDNPSTTIKEQQIYNDYPGSSKDDEDASFEESLHKPSLTLGQVFQQSEQTKDATRRASIKEQQEMFIEERLQKTDQNADSDEEREMVPKITIPGDELKVPKYQASGSYVPVLDRHQNLKIPYRFDWCKSEHEATDLIKEINQAIKVGIYPIRISEETSSSGSYFCLDAQGRRVGVFKPKNEEPYGDMNPRWSKWCQQLCCPCTFGRNCLPRNQGYLSEVAASIVDRYLGLGVVPRTDCVELSSPSFHYGYWLRRNIGRKKQLLIDRGKMPLDDPHGSALFPSKIGSMQTYVCGFRNAIDVMEAWKELDEQEKIPEDLDRAFQFEFERLVILDYAIRNTDRTIENWLINVSWVKESLLSSSTYKDTNIRPESIKERKYDAYCRGEEFMDIEDEQQREDATSIHILPPEGISMEGHRPLVKIAAIDNGLAFPFKHPDKWRSYPYSWLNLPWADRPFSMRTVTEFLPILSNTEAWDDLAARLRAVFLLDDHFHDRTFRRQMALMRGQLFNLREAMRRRETPRQLVDRPWLKIEDLADVYGPTKPPKPSLMLSDIQKNRFFGDTYSAEPGRIYHITQIDKGGRVSTYEPQLMNEDSVKVDEYKNVVPPQQHRWKTSIRERPPFSFF